MKKKKVKCMVCGKIVKGKQRKSNFNNYIYPLKHNGFGKKKCSGSEKPGIRFLKIPKGTKIKFERIWYD